MITSFDDVTLDTPLDFDVAIVGAGAAGITLALELQGSGARVGLFEGGHRERTEQSTDRYRGEVTVGVDMEYPDLEVNRLRYLGGTTNHWGGWCRPLEPAVFRPRPGRVEIGWPFDRADLADDYLRAAAVCKIGRWEFDAVTLCAAAGVPLPFEATGTISTPVWRYSEPVRFGTEYHDALAEGDTAVYLGANCVGLDVEGARVRAIRMATDDGTVRAVRARHVVLACGGIENCRLLLLAARDDVAGLDRSGRLGVGFMEHPHVDAGYVLVDPAVFEDGGLLAASTALPSDVDGTRFRVGLGLTDAAQEAWGTIGVSFTAADLTEWAPPLPYRDGVDALWQATVPSGGVGVMQLFARSEQRPNTASRVSLIRSRDDLGLSRARLDWRVSPDDVRDIEIARRLVVGELMGQGFGPANLGAPELLPHLIDGGGHHMGGAPMHDDPDQGVVDANQRAHALENLFVTGGAVFPTSCFSNPTLTIVALAIRLATHLGTQG